MILADKIIENRKKSGWSQEELADKLGVSRQSVSKWEGAQAVPDMNKILMMADLFGVSTDYLLKDEIETPGTADEIPVDHSGEDAAKTVTMEEASAFLAHNERSAHMNSTAVMLCILSPVPLIVLSGLAEAWKIGIEETVASIAGVAVLLVTVAIAVSMFIYMAMQGKKYEYLEECNIDTAYGVSGMAKERRSEYAPQHTRLLIVGVMLCVICAVPLLLLIITGYSNNSDVLPVIGVALLLIMVAAGTKMCVLTSIRNDGFNKLLEEGDFTRVNKRAGRFDGVYWTVALVIYLVWSFISGQWQQTWIVWPIAGVVFIAYKEIMRMIVRSRKGLG